MVMNRRLQRLNMAKKILKDNPEVSAAEVVAVIRARERTRPDNFKFVGDLLKGFECKTK